MDALRGMIRLTTGLEKRMERLEKKQSPIRGGTDKTIAGGVITADRPYHHLLPESGTTDDLVTINAPYDSKFLLLHTKTAGHAITIKDGTGNLNINGDCVLDSIEKTLYVMWDEVQAKWVEVGRSNTTVSASGKQYGLPRQIQFPAHPRFPNLPHNAQNGAALLPTRHLA